MIARIFLAAIGAAYLLLAGWCIASPRSTAAAVGFDLQRGSGQSEYLTVYGGLQLGVGLFFLWPLIQRDTTHSALIACLCMHAAIVVFRTISFVRYSGISSTTYMLAGVEWVILLGSLWLFFAQSPKDVAG